MVARRADDLEPVGPGCRHDSSGAEASVHPVAFATGGPWGELALTLALATEDSVLFLVARRSCVASHAVLVASGPPWNLGGEGRIDQKPLQWPWRPLELAICHMFAACQL